jgi:hypothetical protein
MNTTTFNILSSNFKKDPTSENFNEWKNMFCSLVDDNLTTQDYLKVKQKLNELNTFVEKNCGLTFEEMYKDLPIGQKIFKANEYVVTYGGQILAKYIDHYPKGHKVVRYINNIETEVYLDPNPCSLNTDLILAIGNKLNSLGKGWFIQTPKKEDQFKYTPVNQKQSYFWNVKHETANSTAFNRLRYCEKHSSGQHYTAHISDKTYMRYDCAVDSMRYPYDPLYQSQYVLLNKMFDFILQDDYL